MKKFYITTAIDYVNAAPHLGHALEKIQADVLARYHRLAGEETFFLTGADENSLKNVLAAEKQKITVKELVDKNTQKFIDLCKALNISNDDFIRTTEKKHFLGVQKLWLACKKWDIYKKKYKGLYCVGCECFYNEDELIDGLCPEHKTKPEVVEEENYFFRLSAYQKQLEKIIKNDEYKIAPETRKNEVLSFIKMGLEDFSISRTKKRARNWGVPVPNDPEQIIYVWFDALSNYITALDYGKDGKLFKKYWPADVHIIGKGIIRFHAVYWPAMLLSAGLSLPKTLFVHGYINIGGEKMSKSLGNIVDPLELAKKYGLDPVRYYLLRHIHPVLDSDFNLEQFEQAYNADLANGLGNLVARVAGLVEQSKVQMKRTGPDKVQLKRDKELKKIILEFAFDKALKYIWDKIRQIDVAINESKPWELKKLNKEKELAKLLSQWAQEILEIANLLKPFLPQTAEKIEKIFTAKVIKKGEPLFPRL